MPEYKRLQQESELPKSDSMTWPDDNEVAFNIVLEKRILRKRVPETVENARAITRANCS